jgi:molecular chaperone IbpA
MTFTTNHFEELFDKFPSMIANSFRLEGNSYPPFNITKTEDNSRILEFALAGFDESEISVSVEGSVLRVSGQKSSNDEKEYIYKGIGARRFEKSFMLPKNAVVEGATFNQGILLIVVKYVVPEELKPKMIPINGVVHDSRNLLTE